MPDYLHALETCSDGFKLRLDYQAPFDWRSMLDFFAQRAIPGVEFIADDSYLRSFTLRGRAGHFALSFSNGENSVRLRVSYPEVSHSQEFADRVRMLFDLDADSNNIGNALAADAVLAPLVARHPGLRVPGCWDGLEIAVRAIVGQQVSVKAAATLMTRLVEKVGCDFPIAAAQTKGAIYKVFPEADSLVTASLSGLGITGQRVEAIQSLASAVLEQRLRFDGSQDPRSFRQEICRIKGIGNWTAQYIALRVLRDPDAFPEGDLILQRALMPEGSSLTAKQLLQLSESWRPWRAYAVMLLWRHYQHMRETATVN